MIEICTQIFYIPVIDLIICKYNYTCPLGDRGFYTGWSTETMMRMAHTTFELLVRDVHAGVMKSLAPELRARAKEVTVVIADRPSRCDIGPDSDDDILGLYEGVSLKDRHIDDMETIADRITLFRLPLLDACDSVEELRQEVRITLIHELGHYFGFEEDELLNRGL
jgi:predicted Zn-dependent protease with MMP-like domain